MSIDPTAVTGRLDLARRIAHEAGQLTLRYFQRPDLAVDIKADLSPVTAADREAEQLLRRKIEADFPDDAILGEEFGERAGRSGYRWVLDPIDGTKSFVHGVPLYGTLVGVQYGEQDVIGVIYIPALGETAYAARGQGAWYVRGSEAPVAARVSTVRTLADSLLLTTDAKSFSLRASGQGAAAYDALQSAARLTRTWGDCYGYLLVATGRADVMVDPIMNVWDAAAVAPIIEEAGGRYSDWRGRPTISGGDGVASNGLVHEAVLAMCGTA
ncbi:MAG: histidinol-phosphatase [Planctomycetes bacterium]|nr:histidinol-phosphatase [Planctomycetota bacterium]